MTASKPDMQVLAVGIAAVSSWLDHPVPLPDDRTLALFEMPAVAAAGFPVGREYDFCSPGFVPDVMASLVSAGVKRSGANGIDDLAKREQSARGKANRLTSVVVSIGQVLVDVTKDAASVPESVDGDYSRMDALSNGLAAISELVESVADEVCGTEPGKAARRVLAAHGWTETAARAGNGKPAAVWVQHALEDKAIRTSVWLCDGRFWSDTPHDITSAVLRAFATLAEESKS